MQVHTIAFHYEVLHPLYSDRVGEKPKHSKTQQNNCGARQKLWWKKTKQKFEPNKG